MEKICNCCSQIIPTFDNLSKENEEQVRKVCREVGPISAIKKLRELTNSSLRDAKFWVDHCGEYYMGKTIPCPFCGELLRTSEAKQCRYCLRDWHDESELKWLK